MTLSVLLGNPSVLSPCFSDLLRDLKSSSGFSLESLLHCGSRKLMVPSPCFSVLLYDLDPSFDFSVGSPSHYAPFELGSPSVLSLCLSILSNDLNVSPEYLLKNPSYGRQQCLEVRRMQVCRG